MRPVGTTGPVEPCRPTGPADHGRPRRPAHPTGPAAGRSGLTVPRATHSSARPISQSRLGTTSPAGVKAIFRSSAWLPESLRQSPLTMSTASLGRGGELQTGVDGRARVEAQVLRREPASEPPGEDLGDQGRGGPARLLAPQPASHGRLVVPQIETVLEAELVHPAGETCVRESGFCDERGELAVGGALRRSFRHQLYGLLPSGPGGQPLWNGANLAAARGGRSLLRFTFIRSCEDWGWR